MTRIVHIVESIGFGLWAFLLALIFLDSLHLFGKGSSIWSASGATAMPSYATWPSVSVALASMFCWQCRMPRSGRVWWPDAFVVGMWSVFFAPVVFLFGILIFASAPTPTRLDLSDLKYGLLAVLFALTVGLGFAPLGGIGAVLFAALTRIWRTPV
ncbi:hypothetical protein [Oleomonas cavernae]|uniref:hypothetical protein n=1 Tax=Oleomonas cavernae TaxID=2320859 RepID=UPI0011C3C2E9|nr:hypothetical protein [Oleomonas cavernae]